MMNIYSFSSLLRCGIINEVRFRKCSRLFRHSLISKAVNLLALLGLRSAQIITNALSQLTGNFCPFYLDNFCDIAEVTEVSFQSKNILVETLFFDVDHGPFKFQIRNIYKFRGEDQCCETGG